jgi:uncharacterized protein YkwD
MRGCYNPRDNPNMSVRRFRVILSAALIGFAIAAASSAAPSLANGCVPRAQIASADEAVEARVFAMINAERAARGLPPFAASTQLTQAARRHSSDMAGRDFFSHEGSDRSDFVKRIEGTCYRFSTAAENISGGYGGDLNAMIKGWMDSPPHRESILSRDYLEAGVGYAINPSTGLVHYWTMNFGTPASGQAAAPAPQPTQRIRPTARPKRPAVRATPRPTAQRSALPTADGRRPTAVVP